MGSIVKGKRMASSIKEVNLEVASKKVWLVKVPKFVAEAWEASDDGAEVAEVAKLTTSGGGKGEWKLTLDPSTTAGLSDFVLKERKTAQDMAVFSTTTTASSSSSFSNLNSLALEGKVSSMVDCRPAPSDGNYLRLKERALMRPKLEARKTIQLTGPPPPTFKLASERTEDSRRSKLYQGKRWRDDWDEVIEKLCGLFEKNQFYRMKDLADLTNQPEEYIKLILQDIGKYNYGGPHRGMWQLKPEYSNYAEADSGTSEDPVVHKCTVCKKDLKSKSRLRDHLRVHSGEKPFKCPECGKAFTTKFQLNDHLRLHSGEKPFKCYECDMAFAVKRYLVRHLKVHTDEKKFQCPTCDKAFTRKQYLNEHRRQKCGICTSKGTTAAGTEGTQTETPAGVCPYKCIKCDRAFKTKGGRATHFRVHIGEKFFQCLNCNTTFETKSGLTQHRKIHNDGSQFKCNEFDKACKNQVGLSSHLSVHTNERPFRCPECDKACKTKGGRTTHLRMHSGEKLFQCSECDKAFTYKRHLTFHLKVHSNEKPFHCTECDKSFVTKPGLASHLSVHTKGRAFKCTDCDKDFKSKKGLTYHLRVHSGEKPFQCNECDETFTYKRHLTEHQRLHAPTYGKHIKDNNYMGIGSAVEE